jgi:hypothetical protein
MPDEGALPDPAAPPELGDPSPAAPNAPPNAPAGSAAAALSADLTAAWSRLDRSAQLLAAASVAAFAIVLVGLPLGVWGSAQFALLVLVASVATATTAWFGGGAAVRSLPIPLPTIELAAGLVATVLAVLKLVEILFDIDDLDDSGGIIGLMLAVALAIAAVALLVLATRRGADLRGAVTRGDDGTKLAAMGLALVLLGWAFNLSISFWTMGQAALPLAVLSLAALTVAEAPRIAAPFPVAWAGAAIGVFGAILALGHWADLTSLGAARVELDPADFLGFLGYTVGTGLIIAGGLMSGLKRGAPGRAPGRAPADGPIDPA